MVADNAPSGDREPQPEDGPDYPADHRAWAERNAPMVSVTVVMPAAYLAALDDLASVRGGSRSAEVRFAVRKHLAGYPRHAEVARDCT